MTVNLVAVLSLYAVHERERGLPGASGTGPSGRGQLEVLLVRSTQPVWNAASRNVSWWVNC